jgi:hypothetical protein
MTKPNVLGALILGAFFGAPSQAGDARTAQSRTDPCTPEIAAYAAKLHTTCFVYAEQAAADAQPIKALHLNDGLHAGEQVACTVGSEVTITYCASRADVDVRAAAGFATTGVKVKRYTIANVPRKNPEEQPHVAPALRMAMESDTELLRYFVADTWPTMALGLARGKSQAALDPREELDQLLEAVRNDRKLAYAALSMDGRWNADRWTAAQDPVGEIAYCARSDGLVIVPKALAGMHLNAMKDSDGQPFGEVLANLAHPDAITTLKSKWQFPGTAPVDVTTYASKVEDVICAVNVSKQIPETKPKVSR